MNILLPIQKQVVEAPVVVKDPIPIASSDSKNACLHKIVQGTKNADPSEGDTTPTSKESKQQKTPGSAEGDVPSKLPLPVMKAPRKAKKKLQYPQDKENIIAPIQPNFGRTVVKSGIKRNNWDLSFQPIREDSQPTIQNPTHRVADISIYDFE
jgi:hypothetical protein